MGDREFVYTQWPITVAQDHHKSRTRLILVIMISIVILGALGYLAYMKLPQLISKYRSKQSVTTPDVTGLKPDITSQNKNVQSLTANTSIVKNANGNSSAQQGNKDVNKNTAEVKPPDTQTGTQTGQTNVEGGKISLQAVSMPNEQTAKEFSEKLIKAGIPAYVVSADIPGKGRWYRVRAGRFSNSGEAQQYKSAWQQRAASAGINIQFIVCDY